MAEAKIVQGERRNKRKFYFRFGYAEPQSIFVPTKIVQGERRDKRKPRFRFDYAEPQPIFNPTKDTKNNRRKNDKTISPFYCLLQSRRINKFI